MPTPSTPTAGYNAGLFITSTPSVTMTDEAMTDSGDHTTYNVTNSAHQAWDYSASFTVQTSPDGSTWATASASTYTINYAIGQVVFTSAVSGATPSCRIASGYYFTIAFLAGVTAIDGTGTGAALDATSMQNPPSTWKDFISGERSATLKLSTIWVNGGVFLAHMSADDILLLQVYPNQANAQRYQGYGVMTTDSFKSAVSAVNTEEIDFNIKGKLYYLNS